MLLINPVVSAAALFSAASSPFSTQSTAPNEEEETSPERTGSEVVEPRREVDLETSHDGAGHRCGPRSLCRASAMRRSSYEAFLFDHYVPRLSLIFLQNGLGTPLIC